MGRAAVKRFLGEVVGTYCLVFAGTGAIIVNDITDGTITHLGVALTFGLIVMAMVYALGDVSGAHINPAVTLAFATGKRFSPGLILPYLACQFVGALLASATLRLLFLDYTGTLGATLPSGSWWQSFLLEVILTFLLMFVVLRVSTGSKEKGIMAGAAVGAVVALEATFAGPICGASMNPARSLGPAVVSGHLDHLWIYLVAPVLGALLAVPVSDAMNDDEDNPGFNE
ncbi:MAG: aquaporin [Planctomycetaceae bacterium]|nr:aquaporin [Planctomycetaceae bacterium]